jgi:hypothetical protein
VNDLKIHCSINNVHDCKLLQSDIDPVQSWCFENCMILNVGKLLLYNLLTKLLVLTSVTNCVISYATFPVCQRSWSWTVSSIFITILTTCFL